MENRMFPRSFNAYRRVSVARRLATGALAFILAITGSLYPQREAKAALALALLVEPAADFVAGLVFSSIARQTVVTVGVAANDASWLVPLANITSRAIGMLRIAGALSKYEFPLQAGVAIPAVNPTTVTPASGAIGTIANAYPYNTTGVSVYLSNVTRCTVSGWDSIDGATHSAAIGSYGSVAELMASCVAIAQYSKRYATKFKADEILAESPGDPVPVGLVYVQRVRLAIGNIGTADNYDQIMSIRAGVDFSYVMKELPDGNKRFVRTSTGFMPDTADPDWTEAEKASYAVPQPAKFVDAAGKVVTVSADATSTKIDAFAQSGPDVRARTVSLNANAVPSQVTESTVPNAQVADVAAATSATSGTGSSSSNLVLPTDYARAGEAASAANVVKGAIDGAEISSVSRPWESATKPDFNEQKDRLENLTVPDIGYSDWFPSLMPGAAVQCHSLEFRGQVTSGPAAGLDSSAFLDLCPYFEYVRAILGYLFGVGTVIYGWRRFIGARAPMGA